MNQKQVTIEKLQAKKNDIKESLLTYMDRNYHDRSI